MAFYTGKTEMIDPRRGNTQGEDSSEPKISQDSQGKDVSQIGRDYTRREVNPFSENYIGNNIGDQYHYHVHHHHHYPGNAIAIPLVFTQSIAILFLVYLLLKRDRDSVKYNLNKYEFENNISPYSNGILTRKKLSGTFHYSTFGLNISNRNGNYSFADIGLEILGYSSKSYDLIPKDICHHENCISYDLGKLYLYGERSEHFQNSELSNLKNEMFSFPHNRAVSNSVPLIGALSNSITNEDPVTPLESIPEPSNLLGLLIVIVGGYFLLKGRAKNRR